MPEQKTVFISYRRQVHRHFARLLFSDLRALGWDVFFDYEGLDSGEFEQVILSEIGRRAHFILLLGPDSLKGCERPEDWVRREYEQAVKLQRNIVPVLDELEMGGVRGTDVLPGLARLQGIRYLSDYHDAFLAKLSDRFLKEPRRIEVKPPASGAAKAVVERVTREAVVAGKPTARELSAEEWFQRGYARAEEDWEGQIADNTRAIELDPRLRGAYHNRGMAYRQKGDLDRAIADYNKAIELDPKFAMAYYGRGIAFEVRGELDRAIADYDNAIALDQKYPLAYYARGNAYLAKGNFEKACADYDRAISLDPAYTSAWNGRGNIYLNWGDMDRAIADFSHAIALDSRHAFAHYNRGLAYEKKRQFAKAVADFRRAFELCPGDDDIKSALLRLGRG